MQVYNFASGDPPLEREGRADGYRVSELQLGPLIGAERIGATLYELQPGNSNCPYHYEYGREEWLVCLQGQVAVRTPDGDVELRRGDVVVFPEGPAGAHKVTATGGDPARVLIMSTKGFPWAVVYPDSDKVAVMTGPRFENRDRIIVRRESAVDYWDGEP